MASILDTITITNDPKHVLGTFCETLLKEVKEKNSQNHDDSEKEVILSRYEEKSESLCKEINHTLFDKDSVAIKYLQDASQLVLDMTYVDECDLVNKEFPVETSWTSVKHISSWLNNIEIIAEKVIPSVKPIDTLGSELLECVRWRRGALCYMYCHTLNTTHNTLPDTPWPCHYRQVLEQGVGELLAMLTTRANPHWLKGGQGSQGQKGEGLLSNDKDAAHLFLEGILSDTHMLALMYCGELCYWHACATDKGDLDPGNNSDPDFCDFDLSALLNNLHLTNNKEESLLVSKSEKDYSKSSGTELSTHAEEAQSKDNDIVQDNGTCENKLPDRIQGSTVQSSGVNVKFHNHLLRDIGTLCLKKYVEIAKGPLDGAGWTTEQANTFLKYLDNF